MNDTAKVVQKTVMWVGIGALIAWFATSGGLDLLMWALFGVGAVR